MNKMLRVSIAFCLIIGTLVHSAEYGRCPKIPTEYVDVNRLAGIWYGYARSSNNNDGTDRCDMFNWIASDNGGTLFVFSDISTLINENSTLVAEVNVDNNSLNLKMHLPVLQIIKAHHYVLETDYRNYEIVYGCEELGPYHESSAWVVTRTLQPMKNLDQIIENAFRKRGLTPLTMIKDNQQNCFTK